MLLKYMSLCPVWLLSQVAAKGAVSEGGSKCHDGEDKNRSDDSGSDEAPVGGMMSLLKRFGGGTEASSKPKAKPAPKSRAGRVEPRPKASTGTAKKASSVSASASATSTGEKSEKGKKAAPAKTVVGNAGTSLLCLVCVFRFPP